MTKVFGVRGGWRGLGAVSLLALAAAAAPAHAQDDDAPVRALPTDAAEEGDPGIVVTGSFIPGTPEDASLPVDVITAQELQKRGAPSMVDIVKSLPQSGPALGDTNQFTTAAQFRIGGGSINLRGLGPQRTLVLLNSRRFQYGQVDTNMLPLAALGRIEILKDGAAATYGSDAVAGVANFITRTDLDGVDLAGNYRYVDGSDGDWDASVAFGWKGDSANLLVSAGYQHRSELSVMDRDWSYLPRTVNPTSYSILGNPGIMFPVNAFGLPSGTAPARDANCVALGGEDGFSGAFPACYFAYAPYLNLVETEDRFQVYGETNAELGASVRVHFEAMYAFNDTPDLRSSPGYPPTSGMAGPGSVNVFSTPIANPGAVTALQQAGYTPAQIAGTSAVFLTFWRPFATGGNPMAGGLGGASSDRRYQLFRTSLAFDGDIGDSLHWMVAGTYSWDDAYARTPDILTYRLQSALNGLGGPNCAGTTPGANGCQYFNPFSNAIQGNPALGGTNPGYTPANANSAALNNWLFGDILQNARSEFIVVDAVLDGKLGIGLPGGDVGFAVGGQYRKLDYAYDPLNDISNANIHPCPTPGVTNCAFRTGAFIFQGQTAPVRLKEEVKAVFAEVNLPITDRINAQAALRYEDYGGLTGSTVNPKFAAKWDLADWFGIRGSVQTTFRGPAPGNRSPGGTTGLTGITAAGNAFKAVDFFGNPAVGPESAFSFNAGALAQSGGFRASIDYWDYKLDDQIVTVPANVIATAVAGAGSGTQFVNCASPLRGLITFNNSNSCTQGTTIANDIARIRSDTTNGPTIRTSGIDINASYRFEGVLGGSLTFDAAASIVLAYEQDAFVYNGTLVSPAYDAKGFANYDRLPGTVSDWRGNFFVEYAGGAHVLRLTYNYIDGVIDNRGPTATQTGANAAGCSLANATAAGCQLITFGQEVDAFQTVDLNYTLSLPWDVTLSLAVLNLTDTTPPEARLELSYDPFIGNPYGRTVKLGFRKKF